jgi:hypothetical protein
MASLELAKKQSIAGILRAQNMQCKHRHPHHPALAMFVVLTLFAPPAPGVQNIERHEGILIDTSGSISRGRTTHELFHEHLISTKKLLLAEPPNGRVRVSTLSIDSFAGSPKILKGWTPDARGIVTDDLKRGPQVDRGLFPFALQE